MGGKTSYGEWVEWVVKSSYGEWVVRGLTGSGFSG